MLDELQRRNYAQNTVRAYIHAIEDFAKYFHRSPDRIGPEHIREYQVHLFRDCKLSAGTIEGRTAALRFLFVKTLRRPYLPDHCRALLGADDSATDPEITAQLRCPVCSGPMDVVERMTSSQLRFRSGLIPPDPQRR